MTETAHTSGRGAQAAADRPATRTAVVFVHGQGEQRPMQSVRDLVRTAWRTDPHLSEARRRDDKTPTGALRAWSTPDEDGEIYELRRIATEAPTEAEETLDGAEERRRFDFYEYYWAHLIEGTRAMDLIGWVKEILARPLAETPSTIRPIRKALDRFAEIFALFAVAFATLTAALVYRAGPTPGLAESFEIARQTLEVRGLLAAIDPINALLGQVAFGLIPLVVIPLSLLFFVFTGDREAAPAPPPPRTREGLRAEAKDRARPLANLWMYWSVGVIGVFLAALSVEPSSQMLAALSGEIEPPTVGVEFRFIPFILAIGASIYALASARSGSARLLLLMGVALLLAFFAQGVDGRVHGALAVLSFLVLAFAWRGRRLEAALLALTAIAASLVARIAMRDNIAIAGAEFSDASAVFAPITWAYVYGFGVALFTLVPTADRPFGARAWWLALTVALSAAGASLTMFVGAQDVNRVVAPWSSLFTPGDAAGALSAYSIVLLHDSMSTVILLCGALFAVAAWAARDSFLLPVLGDSARYLRNTPRNVERRQRIRREGVELLERLHASGKYDRIVVVGHSLGSVVAYDILSHLWGRRVDALHAPGCELAMREAEAAARRLVLRAVPEAVGPARALGAALVAAGVGPRPPRGRRGAIDAARHDLAHEHNRHVALAAFDGLAHSLKFCRGPGAKAAREAADHLTAGPARFASAAGALEAFAVAQGTDRGRRGAVAAAAQDASAALSEVADAFAAWRDAQSHYAAALSDLTAPAHLGGLADRENKAWLVTDFVTLGSPLHFGAWLFAQSAEEFAQRKLDREVLTNPPFLDVEPPRELARDAAMCFSHVRASAVTEVFGPSHGALFAAVRWTNLFFRTRHILAGDIIGGPLWRHFDFGVADIALDRADTGKLFAHNEYWRSDLDEAALRAEPPEHIEALRAALDLARPQDGRRTPPAPGRAIIAQLRQVIDTVRAG